MMPSITIELAGIPIAKGRPRATRRGFVYTPARTKQNEAALKYAAMMVMGDRAPLEGALAITITAVFPIPISWSKRKQHAALMGELHHTSKPDADNLLKSIDALGGICFRDDSQAARVEVIKLYGTKPRMTIEITEIENSAKAE
jgi:Holliday junction resolvase RusA-like endonuclease